MLQEPATHPLSSPKCHAIASPNVGDLRVSPIDLHPSPLAVLPRSSRAHGPLVGLIDIEARREVAAEGQPGNLVALIRVDLLPLPGGRADGAKGIEKREIVRGSDATGRAEKGREEGREGSGEEYASNTERLQRMEHHQAGEKSGIRKHIRGAKQLQFCPVYLSKHTLLSC